MRALSPSPGVPMSVVRMNDLDLANQRVLIREDLNVPIEDGRITSETRILAALPADGPAIWCMWDMAMGSSRAAWERTMV